MYNDIIIITITPILQEGWVPSQRYPCQFEGEPGAGEPGAGEPGAGSRLCALLHHTVLGFKWEGRGSAGCGHKALFSVLQQVPRWGTGEYPAAPSVFYQLLDGILCSVL